VADLTSDALILLGHGTDLNPDSATAVFKHADNLRERGIFAEVHSAFWKQSPGINDVLTRVSAHRVFIVPMFVSDGYFSGRVIPKALGFGAATAAQGSEQTRILRQGDRTIHYTAPVGTHPEMAGVIALRAEEVMRQFPGPEPPLSCATTLLIAGHGTGRSKESRESADRHAETLRTLQRFVAVHTIFMEEPPFIRDWQTFAQTRSVVVVPFFISEGLHVAEDIPVMLGDPENEVKERLRTRKPPWNNPTERNGKLVWYAASTGTSELVTELILARVKQAREAGG
jgi:sirohydrochlorin cobaltochelatase